MPERTMVIGVGNELRGDDGAGIAAARRLCAGGLEAGVVVREHQGEPTALLEIWREADAVVLIDAVRSGAPAGTISRFDVSADPLPARWSGSSSTHAIALAEAIELARSVGRLPARLIVFGVEGSGFAAGADLTPEVAQAVPGLVEAARSEAVKLAAGQPPLRRAAGARGGEPA